MTLITLYSLHYTLLLSPGCALWEPVQEEIPHQFGALCIVVSAALFLDLSVPSTLMVEVLASTSPSAPEDIRRDSLRGRGRAAFRGRGRGRSQGRSAGRAHGYGPGDYVGVDTALDQQHAGAAAGPAPQVPAVNSIAGRVDRGRGPRQHSSRPQSQESASNTGQATGQRQPRQRNAGQSRQRASRELNHRAPTYQPSSREELHGRHAALEEISRSATGAPDCVVCCEPIQVPRHYLCRPVFCTKTEHYS